MRDTGSEIKQTLQVTSFRFHIHDAIAKSKETTETFSVKGLRKEIGEWRKLSKAKH